MSAGAITGPWIVGRRRPAGLRLYCFPHAGGSAGEYLRWGSGLPEVSVLGIQPPGRAGRLAEPPIPDVARLVADLVRAVRFEPPFALFGHSLGALVAFETARALRAAAMPGPTVLFASAQRPPHLPHPELLPHDAPDDALVRMIGEDSGPLAAELLEDPQLLHSVLGAYRADLAAAAAYVLESGAPLECPIVAVGGRGDSRPETDLAQWRQHTTGGFALHMLPGDHFYLRTQQPALLRVVRAALAT